MSDSRLEKFIYAICSMDVSDLPVPLSRIEKLWNCLITGETPDFEPLSRNEKYLMAMLDRYDISNLPAPMSRGEKLLYKIAVGETDLSDVPGYLSRYEELLKYLIENGGISGGDFEYVLYTINQSLYTLYTTAEKPVKSAILSGQTLVNIAPNMTQSSLTPNTRPWKVSGSGMVVGSVSDNKLKISTTIDGSMVVSGKVPNTMKPSTKYYVQVEVKNNSDHNLYFYKVSTQSINLTTGLNKFIITTVGDFNVNHMGITMGNSGSVKSGTEFEFSNLMIIEYQDGMENWDIPFFEGMQSVKMPVLTTTGKNLFDMNHASYITGLIHVSNQTINQTGITKAYYIPCEPNTSYTISKMMTKYFRICETSVVPTYGCAVSNTVNNPSKASLTITTSESAKYLCFNVHNVKEDTVDESEVLATLQIEKGTVATAYEPYKSNILTTPEDLELRGIDDVQDTLDCLTGELTERIKTTTLDKFTKWSTHPNVSEGFSHFTTNITDISTIPHALLCDSLPAGNIVDVYNGTSEGLYHSGNKYLHITIKTDKLSENNANGLNQYLKDNIITIQYPLETESIKTVDLTTVDQDNQPTQLGTFENLTHVSLESAGLIPEVEMEVATKLLEDTVFNLTNAFNTLYPTASKPVVDGTLTGQTLVNIVGEKYRDCNLPTNQYVTVYGMNSVFDSETYRIKQIDLKYPLIPNKPYLVIVDVKSMENCSVLLSYVYDGTNTDYVVSLRPNKIGLNLVKFTPTTATTRIAYYVNSNTEEKVTFGYPMIIEYQKGMENWNIPYFEGMQSVQAPGITMTGKNLFDGTQIDGFIYSSTTVRPDSNVVSILLKVDKNTDYILSTKTGFDRGLVAGSLEPIKIGSILTNINSRRVSNTIAFNSGESTYILVYLNSTRIDIEEIQVEKGTVATPYEPFKSTTLSTPSDLELRKVGDVQDEVNVMTGEVMERIREIVLDDNMNWQEYNKNITNTYCGVLRDDTISDYNGTIYLNDKLTQLSDSDIDSEGIRINSSKRIFVRLNRSKGVTDLATFKQYLSQNPITIQYQLSTPTIKTVDLTIVNQDGNETKLRTFDDTTHVLLNSEGLIPKASLTVRTKIPSASSTSLLMDELSTEQQQLESTVNEQSNNVDATMIATTEIYEETL